MCGIAGYCSLNGSFSEDLRAATDSLAHRGPDDFGTWVDGDAGVGLGHRRLSILDLSAMGKQPMHSACGRYAIAYNGEIYNHLQLRNELGDQAFKSTSDTETALACFSRWGVRGALERFVGMFAIALWDKLDGRLYLMRDRMGIKPLYYGRVSGGWVFGSELKALTAFSCFEGKVNRDALALFFRHNYIPPPYSIYEKTWKLRPGEIVEISSGGESRSSLWWDIESVWRDGANDCLELSDADAVAALEDVLGEAVRDRMLSDVPLGAFLSGGIDSSAVVALMQKASSRPVKTFTIGFNEAAYNEASHAREVSILLGTDHTELFVTPSDMLEVIPSISRSWDEPFADSSQIPTYLLSRLTRESVTVSLSGDGGDELFSGYERYFEIPKVWERSCSYPEVARRGARILGSLMPHGALDHLGSLGPKLLWRMDALGMRDFRELYRYLTSHSRVPAEYVIGATEPATQLTGLSASEMYSWMSLYDLCGYLPEDILTKVDRASMAFALEVRVPVLDHRVVQFASRLPLAFKVRDGHGKWALRQMLYKYVPRELVDRPKMGFGVPVSQWLRKDLKEWCLDLLKDDRIRRQGYLKPARVRMVLDRFMNGEDIWTQHLWNLLMFQDWLEEWRS